MQHWIGTSGFQYSEWKGTFYPETMSAAKMLPFYAERFATTEINYTFRQIPSAKSIERWAEATPARFKFSFKAPQKVTHFAKLRDCADTVKYFHSVLSGLGEKLGVVLFQLPGTFKKDATLLGSFFSGIPRPMRVAFEFRHESWFADEVYEILHEHNAALCVAETEELATPFMATADFGFLRLRREDYSSADIARWGKAIEKHAKRWSEVFVYFKHEDTGSGPRFARQLLESLE
jgi:uncharacterized protein YecE (DUF72 family)